MTTEYNPSNRHEIKVWDVEFRRDPARTLMARIYQPQGEEPFPALFGSARGRVEQPGPHRQCADGGKGGGERSVSRRHRHAPWAGGAVPGLDTGRELWSSLAQGEGARMERRSRDSGRAGKLQRRPRNRALRHAPTRPALQRPAPPRSAQPRRDTELRRRPLAGERSLCSLSKRREERVEGDDRVQQDLFQSLG